MGEKARKLLEGGANLMDYGMMGWGIHGYINTLAVGRTRNRAVPERALLDGV
jgi:hypothetical protein